MNLDTPIQFLKGVGPKMALKLGKLGIRTIEDLLFYFPRTWLDLSTPDNIGHARIGDQVVINGQIISISQERSFKKRMAITRAEILSGDGEVITAVWFNQPFIKNNLHSGETWIFYGKIDYDWKLKQKILLSPILEKNFSILSIYPETTGVTSKYLRHLIKNLYDSPISIPDFLPEKIVFKEKLLAKDVTIKEIHLPSSNNTLFQAKYRLAFEELFLIALKMQLARAENKSLKSSPIKFKKNELVKLVKSLPYKLTNSQRKASWQIIEDLAKPHPMNRLLNGDVGSGKTIVAAMAALNVIKNTASASPAVPDSASHGRRAKRGGQGYQVAWMAPTEILARQHYETTCKLLKDFEVKIALVTSNEVTSNQVRVKSKSKSKSKSLKLKKIQLKSFTQTSELIIGTHALIQEGIQFPNLGLVIIDEQHRFGVKQRAALVASRTNAEQKERADLRGPILRQSALSQRESAKMVPHFLSMTATPIPRTLALSLYGDLDISVLNEMPSNRHKIITKLVDSTNRNKAYQFVRDQIKAGKQVFVICPLIETQNSKLKTQNLFDVEKKSVKVEYEKLSKQIFPDLKIGLLHGKLKSREKEQAMRDFKNGEIDILVSTSVVEVGIDIPNATIMIIEDADRFGLAQLHQFRGRVGRGQHQSYCLLFTNNLSPETNHRLQTLVDCSDGLKLAEKDLAQRGHGELIGLNQSGLPNLKMASLTDIILIEKTKHCAETVIKDGLDKYPLLCDQLKQYSTSNHLE